MKSVSLNVQHLWIARFTPTYKGHCGVFFGIEDYLRPSELIGLDITVRRIATGRSIALRCCY